MGRRSRGPAGRSSEHLRSVQRFASMLQRAVDSGRARRRDMVEVDRYLSDQLVSRITSVLSRVDQVRRELISTGLKEKLNPVCSTLTRILEEFSSPEPKGYTTLVQADGSVERSRLSRLIDIDTELLSYLITVEEESARMVKKRFLEADHEELLQVIDELDELLKRRRTLTQPTL